MNRLAPSFLALALLCPVLAHAGPVLERIRSSGKITLAHRESSVPFSYLDADKRPVGYALDLCERLAEAVRRQVGLRSLGFQYVLVTSADRIPTIAEGRADLECGSTTNNAERRKQVAFTIPHYITGTRYLVRADSKVEELAGFAGKKLVSTKGTTPLKAIESANRERGLGIEIVEAPEHARGIEMVERGEAEGFAMDDVLLYGLAAARANPAGFKIVGKFLTIEPLAIMMSKDDPELKKIVDDEMRRLIASHEAHAIYERWFLRPIPPKNLPLNLPMSYFLKDFWKYPTDQVPF